MKTKKEIDGYTQCKEDMKEYIFKVAFQFHRLGKYYGNTSDTHFIDIFEKTIKLINNEKFCCNCGTR